MALDDGLDNIELIIVREDGVRDSNIFEEKSLTLITLVDEKIYVTPIINNKVSSVTLTIILRPYQGSQYSVPVLLETLTLPGKHISIFIMRNVSRSVVLDIEFFKSINRGHC